MPRVPRLKTVLGRVAQGRLLFLAGFRRKLDVRKTEKKEPKSREKQQIRFLKVEKVRILGRIEKNWSR